MNEKIETMEIVLENKIKTLQKYKSAHMTEILKQRRQSLGITQKDLSDHYCNTGVSKYENKHIEGNPLVINEIGAAMKMDTDALMTHFVNGDLMSNTIEAYYLCRRQVLIEASQDAAKTNLDYFEALYKLFVCVFDSCLDNTDDMIKCIEDNLTHLDLLSTIAFLYLQAEMAYIENRFVYSCQLLKLLKPVAHHHHRITELYHQLCCKIAISADLTYKTAEHMMALTPRSYLKPGSTREMKIPLLLMAAAIKHNEPFDSKWLNTLSKDDVPKALHSLYLYVYFALKKARFCVLDEHDYALLNQCHRDRYYYESLHYFSDLKSRKTEIERIIAACPSRFVMEKIHYQYTQKQDKDRITFVRDVALPLAFKLEHIEWIHYYSIRCSKDAIKRKRYREVADRNQKLEKLKKEIVSVF